MFSSGDVWPWSPPPPPPTPPQQQQCPAVRSARPPLPESLVPAETRCTPLVSTTVVGAAAPPRPRCLPLRAGGRAGGPGDIQAARAQTRSLHGCRGCTRMMIGAGEGWSVPHQAFLLGAILRGVMLHQRQCRGPLAVQAGPSWLRLRHQAWAGAAGNRGARRLQ